MMMTEVLKEYCTIGCCGIDCGLCPAFHSKGDSACPGCGGLNFKEKHPSCGFLTCCAIKNKLEVCADCKEYPCRRFDSEKEGFDSFVTHKKVFANLDFINNKGIVSFAGQQITRMNILKDFIAKYDDGRSKSFFCISCALLPLDKLQEIKSIMDSTADFSSIKENNKRLKEELKLVADSLEIDLKLNRRI